MVNVTPAGITPGSASDGSVVHASDAALGNLSRSHDEREISRLQSAILAYDAAKTYEVGDLVRESGFNWICVTQITVPEAFDDSKWNFVDNGLGVVFVAYDLDAPLSGEFFVVMGGDSAGDTTEGDTQSPVAGEFSLLFFTIQVQTNTRPDPTEFAFRKNGADSVGLITVGAGLTGVFQDLTNTEDLVLGDLINYQYRELVSVTGGMTMYGSSCATRRTET